MSSKALVYSHNPAALSSESLGVYLREIGKYPLLSVEEESKLVMKLRGDSDRDSAQKLVLSNLRFVVHIAKTYQGYGLSLADLIQEGNVGLIKSIKKFDPERGVRLITFSAYWIRAEIHEFIIKNWKLVKIATTKAQRKLFYKLRGMKKSKNWFTDNEIQSISKELGVKPTEVKTMEQRMIYSDLQLDAKEDENGEEFPSLANQLTSGIESQPEYQAEVDNEMSTKQELLTNAMKSLSERSKRVIELRFLQEKKFTLDEISKQMSISIERVRQIESQAINMLRKKVDCSVEQQQAN